MESDDEYADDAAAQGSAPMDLDDGSTLSWLSDRDIESDLSDEEMEWDEPAAPTGPPLSDARRRNTGQAATSAPAKSEKGEEPLLASPPQTSQKPSQSVPASGQRKQPAASHPLANLDAKPVAKPAPQQATASSTTEPQVAEEPVEQPVAKQQITKEVPGNVQQPPQVPLVDSPDTFRGRLQVTQWQPGGASTAGAAVGQIRYRSGQVDIAGLTPGNPVTMLAAGGQGGRPPRVLHLSGALWDESSDETARIVEALLRRAAGVAQGDGIDTGADHVLVEANAPVLTPEMLGVYGFEQLDGGLWHTPTGALIAVVRERPRPEGLVVVNCETVR